MPSPSTQNLAAVIGVGETDYADDYDQVKEVGANTDGYGYAATAFKRALAESGLRRERIGGLIVGPTISYERTAELLSLNPRWSSQRIAGKAVIEAALAIEAGAVDTVALIYGNNQQSVDTQYGGPDAMGGEKYLSYAYYAPWGMTSQGALYAMTMQRYMHEMDLTERELGHVAVAQRKHAQMNPKAIMRDPLDIDSYLDARYIVEPLRLYDYCLVNNGGVALILTNSDLAAELCEVPIYVRGFGQKDLNTDATQLRPRLMEYYRSAQEATAKQVFSRADLEHEDIDALQVYDSFSPHIIFALEGFGFVDFGNGGEFVASGATEPEGELPVNTSGGHLSETYMQGWNHQVEAVRQLRGTAGDRQVSGCQNVLYACSAVGKVHGIAYSAEAGVQ